jgi:hypothetical protein
MIFKNIFAAKFRVKILAFFTPALLVFAKMFS